MDESSSSLLQRYRDDRRKLLEFLLSSSSGFIQQIRTPSGLTTSLSNIDFDFLSADYVIHCIQSSGVLDISKGTTKHIHESTYPVTIHSPLGDSYFLLSDSQSAGSPPRRVPPPVQVNHTDNCESRPSDLPNHLSGRNVAISGDGYDLLYTATEPTASKSETNVNISSLGLPNLTTVLSDDDLRESAYEILLACMLFAGVEVHSVGDKKKEKSSRFLAVLKNKREKRHLQSRSPDRHSELIDSIRVQMQISEAMDTFVRQTLVQFASRKTCGQIDVPQILLGLLNGISKPDFLNEKSYTQWKKRQANILEELFSGANHIGNEQLTSELSLSLAKIRNSEEFDIMMSPSERAEVLLAIRQVALVLSSVPGHFGIQGETYYWSAGYHVNIRLYAKLLFSLFDILEEGQLIEEADEILKIIKLTWSVLGITQKLHDALYLWVLFQQFVLTEEALLLDHATVEVQKFLFAEDNDQKEELYMNNLLCSTVCNGSETRLGLMQAIFMSMSLWFDSKLQDYHLHFSQKPRFFRSAMTMALAVGTYNSGEPAEIKSIKSDAWSKVAARKVRTYVERSIAAAYRRVEDTINLGSKIERTHPLAVLAVEVRLIAERELTVFSPLLNHWCPDAGMISAILLHQFYGERLKPFLKTVTCLSEDVRAVLHGANALECSLTELCSSACEENGLHYPFSHGRYQIGVIARPIILDWVIAQHARILEWTGRAFDLEDWGPISYQQKQAASAVEVFRIIEETVDQFFGLSLPMDITHLQALISIIFHTLDAYLLKVVSQLVETHHLYPSTPPLTRYKEPTFPVIKKKLVEHVPLEEEVNNRLNELTISKLCVRVNTLQYIQKQITTLEDGIRRSWASARPSEDHRCSEEKSPKTLGGVLCMCNESVDELFIATFDSIRDTAADSIRKFCNFTGARVVFWDLRDSFLFHLYHGTVEGARLDSVLPHFDSVLNHICGLVDDTLRDLVVSSIYKASLEGYVWLLLDGGPSCAFSDSDIPMMEDDLNKLKDLFVADGEGLPRSLVEEEAKLAHQILNLFSLQTESIIQMLMTASENISSGLDSCNNGAMFVGDAHTLIRVLCHKKDREASKFLKRQYQLPASSEYDDTPLMEPSSKSPLVSDFLMRSVSIRWSEKGHSSFRSIKKKLQEATLDIRHGAW